MGIVAGVLLSEIVEENPNLDIRREYTVNLRKSFAIEKRPTGGVYLKASDKSNLSLKD
jgi:hypothetical protein